MARARETATKLAYDSAWRTGLLSPGGMVRSQYELDDKGQSESDTDCARATAEPDTTGPGHPRTRRSARCAVRRVSGSLNCSSGRYSFVVQLFAFAHTSTACPVTIHDQPDATWHIVSRFGVDVGRFVPFAAREETEATLEQHRSALTGRLLATLVSHHV